MKEKELRRTLAVLPIGTAMKLTDLSARQIRYYEDQELIRPKRNEGNQRMFSLNDIDRLLEIKDYLADGMNIAGIKYAFEEQKRKSKLVTTTQSDNHELTDDDVRRILREELLQTGGLEGPDHQIPGFFHKKPL
ncbi:glutamine synthetase repressor [Agrilactobacillus composti DSM 18527 = JCM 14202]|uniref:Glutamine synthetase repressor n=1 Tax=Agrilactobacillus composti DSM 18527 = JCM 14202 TaxID=1423734 RepID=X0PE28_9LACO|nr:MerR family transcriptional regulator [Agrilactobacillus composti]KRM35827.1 glutamine synthetase repressor [Agrilactobacillus composti DSM 18527 = JCM 14202]MCH4170574.1 MerR family transcriptional regulator [Lactobacillus sp.]GAF39704.1 transcriptional regulator, repressor of the glutamine synthetase, MerR family [Agrilactobacillus composti DSM 18527 = JCM 14202]